MLLGIALGRFCLVIAACAAAGLLLAHMEPAKADSQAIRQKPVTAWLQQHDWESGVALVATYADIIGTVSPLWWEASTDGSIRPIPGAHMDDPALRAIAETRGIALMPLVSDVTSAGSEPERIMAMLQDQAARIRQAAAIAALAESHGYEGIDLDYEGIRVSDMDAYASFVEELADDLHADGKLLAVALEVRQDPGVLPAWRRIGASADAVELMLYGPSATRPDPLITPRAAEAFAALACQAIPEGKLAGGIAVYGVEWGSAGRIGTGTWQEYDALAKAQQLPVRHDAATGAIWYDAGASAIWLPDAASVMLLADTLRSIGVTKVALWHLGGMDPGILDAIRSQSS